MEEFRFGRMTEEQRGKRISWGEKKSSVGGENYSEMENWLAQAPVKPAAHPNAHAQQSADRQSKTVAPSPSPGLPGGEVLIIPQPARFNPPPRARRNE